MLIIQIKILLQKEFLKFKSNWLIKNSNLELIEEYLIKNQITNLQPELMRYLVDMIFISIRC